MNDDEAIYMVNPRLIKRECGGWLAVTPKGWPICIGVTADTATEAKKTFNSALERWSKIQDPATG